MRGAVPPLPQYAFTTWCLVKQRDNFTISDQHVYYPRWSICLLYTRVTIKQLVTHTPGINESYFKNAFFYSDNEICTYEIHPDSHHYMKKCDWKVLTNLIHAKTHLVIIISIYVEMTGYGLEDRVIGVRFSARAGNFSFLHRSRPTQPIQWVPGALSLGVYRPGSESDHTPPSSVEDKECVELQLQYSNTSSWHDGYLSTGTLPLYCLCRNT
jgi:hypothetical protein